MLDGARVPVANRLGEEGDGFRIAMAGLDGGRLNIAAASLGGAQSAFDKALSYMKERKAFGQPLTGFQALQFTLADMAANLEICRTFLWRAASALEGKEDDPTTPCPMPTSLVTDRSFAVAHNTLPLHVGQGYT